jgi:hypothetical protein
MMAQFVKKNVHQLETLDRLLIEVAPLPSRVAFYRFTFNTQLVQNFLVFFDKPTRVKTLRPATSQPEGGQDSTRLYWGQRVSIGCSIYLGDIS